MSATVEWSQPGFEEIRERAQSGRVAYEQLIERPVVVRPRRGDIYVFDRRSSERSKQKRFAAVVMAIAGSLSVFLSLRAGTWERTLPLIVGVALVASAAAVWRSSRLDREFEVPLAWVSPATETLRVREHPAQSSLTDSPGIDMREVVEVVYATRHLPIREGSNARVDGAGVFVRLVDGTVWPVIPSTFARDAAFGIAMRLARAMGVGVKQVGRGWGDG